MKQVMSGFPGESLNLRDRSPAHKNENRISYPSEHTERSRPILR